MKLMPESLPDLFVDLGRDAYRARPSHRFQAGGDVDAVAIEIVALDDDAKIAVNLRWIELISHQCLRRAGATRGCGVANGVMRTSTRFAKRVHDQVAYVKSRLAQ
jgi:hypothetical protein